MVDELILHFVNYINWEIWAQEESELNHVIETINRQAEDFKKNRAKDPEAMVPQQLHPKQIASRMKKPNKIAIPYSFWFTDSGKYSFWEAGFLFITWYTPWKLNTSSDIDQTECAHFAEMYTKKMEDYGFPPVTIFNKLSMAGHMDCFN